jgi:hypothetical protein
MILSGPASLGSRCGGDVLLADHWWWSTVSQLDMTVLAHTLMLDQAGGDELREAMIARAAGFDPRLAAFLVDSGARGADSIRECLVRYGERWGLQHDETDTAIVQQPVGGGTMTNERSVPDELAGFWARGLVNRMRDGGIRWHSAALAASRGWWRVERSLWSAQASVLLPLLDEQRVLICDYLDRRFGDSWRRRSGEVGPVLPDAVVDFGRLKHMMEVDERLRREPSAVRDLVRWIHLARNELAHLRLLQREEIGRGRRLMRHAASFLGEA